VSTYPIPPGELSVAEMRVLHGLAEGFTLRQVAALHRVSHQTVRTQAGTMRRRLGARTTPHAVAIAMQRGLLAFTADLSTPTDLAA
jgi:DNA-binding CsgD family transcriptional regulator